MPLILNVEMLFDFTVFWFCFFFFCEKGCPWSSGGAGGGQKCPKTGAVGSKAQCPGSNKSGCGSTSGKSK